MDVPGEVVSPLVDVVGDDVAVESVDVGVLDVYVTVVTSVRAVAVDAAGIRMPNGVNGREFGCDDFAGTKVLLGVPP